MWWLNINYFIGRICDLYNHCRRKSGLLSSHSLQTTLTIEFPNMKWCRQLEMNNRIHLHWIKFLLAHPEIKTIFNQHLNIPMIDTPKQIYRHKVNNSYIPLNYWGGIDERSFDYTHYCKSVFKPKFDWKSHIRNDIITYNHAEDWNKLT